MNNKMNPYLYGGPGMLPIKKILCPIDFSESSSHAITVARELATYFAAELILLNVISDVPTPPEALSSNFDIDGYKKALVTSSQRSLRKIAHKIDDNTDIKVRSIAIEGNPSERIAKEARREAVDLIIISSHNKKGKGNLVFGSVAERALCFTPCPVLVVPAFSDEMADDVPEYPLISVNADEALQGHLEHVSERFDAVEKNIDAHKEGLNNLLRRRMAEFDKDNERLQRKIDRFLGSTREAWQEIRMGLADLKCVFDRAISKFHRETKDSY